MKQRLEFLQFKEEYQPVRYLGLNLISRKLTLRDCHSLIKFKVESTYGLQGSSHFRGDCATPTIITVYYSKTLVQQLHPAKESVEAS